MAVRVKRQLRGKDGGKHPHVKNAQDFAWNPPSPDTQLSTAALHFIWQFERYARHCSPETVERVREMVRKEIGE